MVVGSLIGESGFCFSLLEVGDAFAVGAGEVWLGIGWKRVILCGGFSKVAVLTMFLRDLTVH